MTDRINDTEGRVCKCGGEYYVVSASMTLPGDASRGKRRCIECGELEPERTEATEGAAKCHHTVSNGFIEVKDSALNGFKTVTLSDDDGREIKLRLSRRVTVFLWEMLSPHVKVEPLE